jgi:aryl-alcohol dehydrogenase-like predicted oxidoreductase
MEMRMVGNSGLEISRLGLGTMTWGRDTDTHEAADQARAYIEAGGNFFDSASHYGNGDSERVIGGLIGTLFRREDVVISTKAGVTYENGSLKTDASRPSLLCQRWINHLHD